MPFLCGLGMHKTAGLPRWNDGFYFTACQRCGRDLVRTAFERWTVPDGFRVVWRPDAPQRAPSARLVDAGFADSHDSGGAQVEFPIREGGARDSGHDDDFFGATSHEDAQGRDFDSEPAFFFAGEDRTVEGAADVDDRADADADADVDADAIAGQHAPEPDVATTGDGAPPLQDLLKNLWNAEPAPQRVDDDAEAEADAEAAASEPLDEPEADESDPGDSEPGDYDADEADADESEPVEVAESPADEIAEPQADPSPPRPRYLVIPDFMDERPLTLPYDKATGQITAPLTSDGRPVDPDRDDDRSVLSPGWKDFVRGKADSAGAAGKRLLRHARPERGPRAIRVGRNTTAGAGGFLMQQSGAITAAAVFGGLVLAAAIVDGRNAPAPPEEPSVASIRSDVQFPDVASPPRAADAGGVEIAGRAAQLNDRAFVTASLLNCRAAPSNDSALVRKLERGAEVQVLGADPGWVSVAHRGARCWASVEHLDTRRPG